MKTVNIKGKSYVMVHERISYFREHFKTWSIVTDMVQVTEEKVIFKCIVTDENNIIRATGYACEYRNSSPINKFNYIENCETSSIGRALGVLGIGIMDGGLPTAEDMLKATAEVEEKQEKTNIKSFKKKEVQSKPNKDNLKSLLDTLKTTILASEDISSHIKTIVQDDSDATKDARKTLINTMFKDGLQEKHIQNIIEKIKEKEESVIKFINSIKI